MAIEGWSFKRVVESGNAYQYSHWSKYTKDRDEWYLIMRAQLVPRIAPSCKMHGIITSYRSRLLDDSNMVSGSKMIPDILQRLGYIKNDNSKWWECLYQQHPVPAEEERTVLELSDAPLWEVNIHRRDSGDRPIL